MESEVIPEPIKCVFSSSPKFVFIDSCGEENGRERGGSIDGGFEPFCTFGTETEGFPGRNDVGTWKRFLSTGHCTESWLGHA